MISGYCRSAVLLLPLLAFVAAARAQNPPAQPPPPPEVLRIRVEADRVTAEIRSSPLRHVLEELAARTGIVFEVATAWNPLISLTLYKVPLQEALRVGADQGRPLVVDEPDAPASQALFHLARGLVAATPQELPVVQAPAPAAAPGMGGKELPVIQ